MSRIKTLLAGKFWLLLLLIFSSVSVPLLNSIPAEAAVNPGCYEEVRSQINPNNPGSLGQVDGVQSVDCPSGVDKDALEQLGQCAVTGTDAAGNVTEDLVDCNSLDISPNSTNPIDTAHVPTCQSEGGPFSFVICPMIDWGNEVIERVDTRVRSALEVDEKYYEHENVKNSWARFRNIAYVVLIPIMLVMVMGTALQFNFLDAYTVRRAMPRLLAAVIFMALSYDISIIMIDVTNNVGRGVAGLIAAPFGGPEALTLSEVFGGNALGSGGAVLGGGVLAGLAVAGLAVAAFGILASYLFVAALAILFIFALLTVRELAIVFLIIMSPIAILSWIFAGRDAIWKLWWNAFSKLLMVYPLIVGLLVTGRAFASLAGDGGDDGWEAIFIVFVKLVAYLGPFFFIPVIFKAAGGAVGNLLGQVNDRSKGVFDRQRNRRSKGWKELGHKFERRGVIRPGSKTAKTRLGGGINRLSKTGLALRDSLKTDDNFLDKLSKGNIDAARKRLHREHEGHAGEDSNLLRKLANDNFTKALQSIAAGNERHARIELARNGVVGAELDAEIAEAKTLFNKYGDSILGMAATAKAGSKTSYISGATEMFDELDVGAHGDSILFAEQYNAARGAAERAGRYMLSRISFGEGLGLAAANRQINENIRNGLGNATTSAITYVDETTGDEHTIEAGMTKADIDIRVKQKTLDAMGTYDWNGIHPTDAKSLVSTLGEDVEKIQTNLANDQYANETERDLDLRLLGQRIGQMQSMRANVSATANGEIQRIVADGFDLFREKTSGNQYTFNIDGKDVDTLQKLIDSAGTWPMREFKDAQGNVLRRVRKTEREVNEEFQKIYAGFMSVSRDAGLSPEQKEQMRLAAEQRNAAQEEASS